MFGFYDKYINDVIKPLLPNAMLSTFLTIGHSNSSKISLFEMNSFKGSIYDFPLEKDVELLHFTTVSNLLNIIRSKTLWMKDFRSLEDKSEFVFASKYLENKESNSLKAKILSTSFCLFSETNLRNPKMWKKYADNDKGVCIKFTLKSNRGLPPNFYLSNIIYRIQNVPIQELVDLKERHDNFTSKNSHSISNLSEILFQVASFYKDNHYVDENEIRLMRYINNPSEEPFIGKKIECISHLYNSEENQITNIVEIPVNRDNDQIIAPTLLIDSIILGNDIEPIHQLNLKRIIEVMYEQKFEKSVEVYSGYTLL